MNQYQSDILEAVRWIQSKIQIRPRIGLILGSGLGVLAGEVEDPVQLPYNEIPHFPQSTVEGHAGELVIGRLQGQSILVMSGRFHLYEGYPLTAVTFPIRVMRALGIEKMIVTNAAGGINHSYKLGDLMIIKDHINFTFQNPLIGLNDPEQGVRFPDMSTAYDTELREVARRVAVEQGVRFQEGTYLGLLGPTYETPAEIRMFQYLGGDAVGMLTVPEVIVARHAGIRCLGISCISNMAAGMLEQPLSHEEVMETTELVKSQFVNLIRGILSGI